MREIKFRVWDEQSKLMNNEPHLDVQYGNLTSGYDCEIIMQFTGLKDKNGVDIFESDILKSWYSRDLSMKDIVHTQQVVEYEIEQYSGEAGFEILFPERAEVIGNIFQNLELLETVQK